MKPSHLVTSLFYTAILGQSSSSWQSDHGRSASGLGATALQPALAILASDQTSHVKRDNAEMKRLEVQNLRLVSEYPRTKDSKFSALFSLNVKNSQTDKWDEATYCQLAWENVHQPAPCLDNKYQFVIEHVEKRLEKPLTQDASEMVFRIEHRPSKDELWSGSTNLPLKCGDVMHGSKLNFVSCRMNVETKEFSIHNQDAKAPSLPQGQRTQIEKGPAKKTAHKHEKPHRKPNPLPAAGTRLKSELEPPPDLPQTGNSNSAPGDGMEISSDLEPPSRPKFVLRGEKAVWNNKPRTPAEIEANGGMHARGVLKTLAGEELSPLKIQEGSSIRHHAGGKTREYTRYISTTTDSMMALKFALDEARPSEGFIYKIAADNKMIDATHSQGKGAFFEGQMEQAVVGHIPLDQIEGWYDLSKFESLKDMEEKNLLDIMAKGETDNAYFVHNPHFNREKYALTEGAGSQPQLAGLPGKNGAAFAEDPALALEEYVRTNIATPPEPEAGIWEWARTPGLGPGPSRLMPAYVSVSVKTPMETFAIEEAGRVLPPITEVELADVADKFATQEFRSIMTRQGLGGLMSKAPDLLGRVSAHFKGYKSLASSPISGGSKLSKAGRVAGTTLAVAGILLWVKDVIEAFQTDTSGMDRAATITSIIPFLGCTVAAAADAVERSRINSLDSTLCVVADGFLVSPFFPIGFALHGVRIILQTSTVEFWKNADHETFYMRYYQAWNYQKRQILEKIPPETFARDISLDLESHQVVANAYAAKAAGALFAATLQTAETQDERALVRAGTEYMNKTALESALCAALLDKRSKLRSEIQQNLIKVMETKYEEFDKSWFDAQATYWASQNSFTTLLTPSRITNFAAFTGRIRWRYAMNDPHVPATPGLRPGPDSSRDTVPWVEKLFDHVKAPAGCSGFGSEKRYVSGIINMYQDEIIPHPNSIQEVDLDSAEVNLGFHNQYEVFRARHVFLIPQYTNNAAEACTSFNLILQDHDDTHRENLALGLNGKRRYLDCRKDKGSPPIRWVALWRHSQRSITWADVERYGYSGHTDDINKGRGGDFLSLLWSTNDERKAPGEKPSGAGHVLGEAKDAIADTVKATWDRIFK